MTLCKRMIPAFQSPVHAEMIRDGGSLALIFDLDGCKYWLLFKILFDEMGRRSGYGSPLVVNRTLKTEESISWDEALTWLEDGMKHAQGGADRKWGEAMIETCKLTGELPLIMSESPTELGRIFIGRDSEGSPSIYEFHPFEIQHEWQKRQILSEGDQDFLHHLVTEKGLMLVGGSAYACFEVAARFDLDANGVITGISRLALLAGENFVEILK